MIALRTIPGGNPSAKRNVTPLSVFAAGRQSFEIVVRVDLPPQGVKGLIFDELLLERYGWDFQASRLTKQRSTVRGETIWRLVRGETKE